MIFVFYNLVDVVAGDMYIPSNDTIHSSLTRRQWMTYAARILHLSFPKGAFVLPQIFTRRWCRVLSAFVHPLPSQVASEAHFTIQIAMPKQKAPFTADGHRLCANIECLGRPWRSKDITSMNGHHDDLCYASGGCPPIVCICLFRCFFDYPWRRGGVQRSCLRTSRVVCWVSTHVYVSLYFVSHVNRSTLSVLWHRNECFFINLNERIKNVCATHRPAPLFSHGNVCINGSRDCVDGSQLAGHDDIHTYGDDVHALVTDFLCLPIWWVKDFVLWYRVWQIHITL